MADLHLLALCRCVGPGVCTGCVNWIVHWSWFDICTDPGLGYADVHIKSGSSACGVGGDQSDVMPSDGQIPGRKVLVFAEDAVNAGLPEVAAGLAVAGSGVEWHIFSIGVGADVAGRDDHGIAWAMV